MKTQITFGAASSTFGSLMLFFICLLFSLNSHSQKLQSITIETPQGTGWVEAYKTSNTYENGNLTKELTQDLNGTFKIQTDNKYYPDGTIQERIFQSSFSTSKNKTSYTYTYNGTEKVVTTETASGGNPVWMPNTREIETYNGNYLIKNITQSYDVTLSWYNVSQTIYTNNPDGSLRGSETYFSNSIAWVKSERMTVSNDSNSITELYEKTNDNGGHWVSTAKTIYSPNVLKPTEILYQKSDDNGAHWENDSRDIYEYTNGYTTLEKSQKWVGGDWKDVDQSIIENYGNGTPYRTVYQEYSDKSLKLENTFRYTYYYDTLGLNEHGFEKSFTLYPNPAQDKITIKTDNDHLGTKYLVTDQLGRQFSNGTITDLEIVIDVDQFSSGIYFVEVGQNKNETIKLVKK